MEIKILTDYSIAFDGIEISNLKEGDIIDLNEVNAQKILDRGIGELVTKSPVKENKADAPVKVNKRKRK